MKALTLTQPWASLMDLRKKHIETRSWSTKYRGLLVIHAAKGFPKWAKETCEEPEFKAALGLPASYLPLSRGLCVVRLVDCVHTTDYGSMCKRVASLGAPMTEAEFAFGDYGPGRYAWVTEYVKHLDDPREVRGALGLWEWPEA
jgi:activating signal cointegrator 1